MRILVVSNDDKIGRTVSMVLRYRYDDMDITRVATGIQGIDIVRKQSPVLVLIDSFLPDISVTDTIKKIRAISEAGIIFLSEGQGEIVRAELLEAGADDYVLKPLNHIEFLSKVKALLRRTNISGLKEQHRLQLGENLFIDTETREVYTNGKTSRLTLTEYNLLSLLVKNNGKILTNNKILERIWGNDGLYFQDSVKKYIHRLRSKIEPDPGNPRIIVNERGIGYRILTKT